jgi:hypothetical protein
MSTPKREPHKKKERKKERRMEFLFLVKEQVVKKMSTYPSSSSS